MSGSSSPQPIPIRPRSAAPNFYADTELQMNEAPARIVGGRFEIVSLAGVGGMGQIYRAIDRSNGEPIALKLLRDRRAHDLSRFERESVILSRLGHPALVRYVAHGLDGDGPWLAMEWLEGEDLAVALDRQRPPVDDALRLARRV